MDSYALAIQLTMSGLYHVMLALEDPFSRGNLRDGLDSVHVPELIEVERRIMLKIEREAAKSWADPASREPW